MFGLSRFEWLVLAAALLVCPGLSYAQATASAANSAPAQSLFESLDRNKDGYLTPNELASEEANNRNWIAVDRDRDGRISRAEFGLVSPLPATAQQQPSAAAGASAPKKE
jgi:Ca2+-binding EF-hand superfamily protein